MKKKICLSCNETILAVVPEQCSGFGWSNTPVWVHIGDHVTGKFRTECIQPEEQTEALHSLFSVGAAVHKSLVEHVARIYCTKKSIAVTGK